MNRNKTATLIRLGTALLVLALAPVGVVLARPVLRGERGLALIPVLRNTGFYEIAYAVVLGIGLVL